MSRQLIQIPLFLYVALFAPRLNAGAVSGCDLNSDGVVNVADVQLAIDQTLGILPCISGDLNGDGQCSVADVQLEINAALGRACKSAQSTAGGCAVTSPTATSAQSGVVTWTASLTSLPRAASVDWVFDDFRVIGHVTASPWSLVNYNTGWNLDGPGNVKIIVRDATGASICTSADVPFTTNNWDMGVVLALSSASGSVSGGFTGIPTVSGTMIVDINGNFVTDMQYGNMSIDGINRFSLTSGGDPSMYPHGGNAWHIDTTRLTNGLHSFGYSDKCNLASANCGIPNIGTTGYTPRIFVGGVFNVQNSNGMVVTVLPNITWITMAPGDTFQLTANLLTDSGTSTTTSSCTLGLPGDGATRCHVLQDNACLFPITTDPQFPSQCVAGITPLGASYTSSITPSTPPVTTLSTLQGSNYVTISSSGLMTASSNLGLSYISIQDTTSGKISQPITVEVKASKAVYHYGTCGSVYSTYHAGGNCPSTLLTWLQNYQITNTPASWPDYAKSGASAFEASFHQIPYNGSSINYTTFTNWKNAWTANMWNPIQSVLTGLPELSAVLVGNEFLKYQPDAVEVQQGASAPTPLGGGVYAGCGNGVGTGACDPLGYELDQLAATNRVAAHFTIDEADATYGNGGPNLWFNFAQSYNMVADQHTTPATATSGIWQIVISGCPTQCMATFYAQGAYNMYGGFSRLGGSPGDNVYVTGATNAFLNGNWATTRRGYYCTEWNGILQFNGANTRDGDCANNPSLYHTWVGYPCGLPGETLPVPPGPGSCTSSTNGACATGCTNGTYTVSTDANLAVSAWGGGGAACPNCETPYESGKIIRNDTYTNIIGKFQAHNIPTSWCTRAGADFTTDLSYNGNPAVADGFCTYVSLNENLSQSWGRTFWEYYQINYNAKWGQYAYNPNPSNYNQWRQDSKSYSTKRYGIPATILLGINAESFSLGGRFPACSNQMVSCANASLSNGILTFNSPHGITQTNGPLGQIKLLIGGVKWNGNVTGPSTLQVYGGSVSCLVGASYGTLSITSPSYSGTITNPGAGPGSNGYYQVDLNPHPPVNLRPGTVVTISGSTNCDGNYAFSAYTTGGIGMFLANLSTATAANQTVEVNDDQGQMNPLYDYNQLGNGRLGAGGTSGYEIFTASLGYAGMRLYQVVNEQVLSGQWGGMNIGDGQLFQATSTPIAQDLITLQQRFWDIAQGLNPVKRLAPLFLQTVAPAPVIGPGLPWLATSMETSAAYGNILTTWNTSEMPITATFNVGTSCQVGSNPISVYHASFPHATTELLTGSQSNVTYTWDPGEAIVFACHASSASFVQPYSIAFNSPGGTVNTVVTAVHGNYSGPLGQYFQSSSGPQNARATVCTGSPCTINIDTGVSDVYYNLTYLNSNNAVISTMGPIDIPKAP